MLENKHALPRLRARVLSHQLSATGSLEYQVKTLDTVPSEPGSSSVTMAAGTVLTRSYTCVAPALCVDPFMLPEWSDERVMLDTQAIRVKVYKTVHTVSCTKSGNYISIQMMLYPFK